ncbi:MAG: hypothetical protein ACYDD1_14215 [Caulobacteraceae bacterium]
MLENKWANFGLCGPEGPQSVIGIIIHGRPTPATPAAASASAAPA